MFVCRYCNTEPELKTSLQVYGRNIGGCNFYWVCPLCAAMVGCKHGTFIPMGNLANVETRKLRINAHRAFDPIWKNKYMNRYDAYLWLAKKIQVNPKKCHFSLMTDENLIRSEQICKEYLKGREKNV